MIIFDVIKLNNGCLSFILFYCLCYSLVIYQNTGEVIRHKLFVYNIIDFFKKDILTNAANN